MCTCWKFAYLIMPPITPYPHSVSLTNWEVSPILSRGFFIKFLIAQEQDFPGVCTSSLPPWDFERLCGISLLLSLSFIFLICNIKWRVVPTWVVLIIKWYGIIKCLAQCRKRVISLFIYLFTFYHFFFLSGMQTPGAQGAYLVCSRPYSQHQYHPQEPSA